MVCLVSQIKSTWQALIRCISLETTYFLFKVKEWREWPTIWQPCMWFSQLIEEWMCACFKLPALQELAKKKSTE
jgi:hypothetical protein